MLTRPGIAERVAAARAVFGSCWRRQTRGQASTGIFQEVQQTLSRILVGPIHTHLRPLDPLGQAPHRGSSLRVLGPLR